MEDRWFSVDEIAQYLGVKRDTIYKWIGRRSMPAHKLGRLWKFRKSEIDEWVFANDERRHATSLLCDMASADQSLPRDGVNICL